MAQIPTYGASQQVALDPLQAGRGSSSATAEAFGGTAAKQDAALGGALANAGGTLTVIATEMQQRENADMVFRARSTLGDEYLKWEQEAKNRVGRDAVGLTQDAEDWWIEAEKKHSESLGNDVQRQAFGQYAASMRQRGMDQISNHESAQLRKSAEQSATASIVNHQNWAAAHSNNAEDVQNSRTRMLEEVDALSALNGEGPALRTQRREDALTKFHAGIIQANIDNKPAEAKAYYDANKDEIAGTARAKLERALEIGGIKVRAQEATDSIMTSTSSREEALEKARTEHEGAEEDLVVAYVNQRYNEKNAARAQAYKDAGESAWNTYVDSGFDIAAVPSSVLSAMEPTAQASLMESARRRSESGAGVETDWSMYDGQVNMAYERPDEFVAQDISKVYPYLAKRERDELVALRKKILTSGFAPTDAVSAHNMVNARLNEMSLVGSKNAAARGRMRSAINQALSAAAASRPERKLSDAEEQAIIDRTIANEKLSDPTAFEAAGGNEDEIQTTTQQINVTANIVDRDFPNAKASKRRALKSKFKKIAADMLRSYVATHKRKPSEEERQIILDNLMRLGHIPRNWRNDPEGYYFELVGEKDIGNFVAE